MDHPVYTAVRPFLWEGRSVQPGDKVDFIAATDRRADLLVSNGTLARGYTGSSRSKTKQPRRAKSVRKPEPVDSITLE